MNLEIYSLLMADFTNEELIIKSGKFKQNSGYINTAAVHGKDRW